MTSKKTSIKKVKKQGVHTKKITLPAKLTNAGAVCRLLMNESWNPSSKDYNASDVLTGMQWMLVVLHNRKNNDPSKFMAKNGPSKDPCSTGLFSWMTATVKHGPGGLYNKPCKTIAGNTFYTRG